MKGWIKFSLYCLFIIGIVVIAIVGPIDKKPLNTKDYHQQMISKLDTLKLTPTKYLPLRAGWKKVNITPSYPMPLAGYRMRDNFESVHDSIYARIIVLNVGGNPVYLISTDLLLFPPAIKKNLEEHFLNKPVRPFFYLSSTHTHNSIGGWHDSIIGDFALGKYDENWVNTTSKNMIKTIEEVEKDLLPTSFGYWEADAREFSENRVKPGSTYDGLLRGITFKRSDSTTAQLITFSAHATSISKKSKVLSGDYPAALLDTLSSRTVDFGVFMAGMVGSHRLTGIKETEFDMVAKAGEVLTKKILTAKQDASYDSLKLTTLHLPINFGPSQLRLAKSWKVRNWLFSLLANPLQGEITYLQLNNIILVGTPCDFSGEIFVNHIMKHAQQENKKVIITSFNGDYVGYITEDIHYEASNKEEVMALNWVGPYYGNYFSEMITSLLKKN